MQNPPSTRNQPTLQCITHEGHDHLRSIVWALNNPICLQPCRDSGRRALEETKLQLVQSPSSTSPSKIYCSLPPYWRKLLYFNHLERPLKITQNHNKVPMSTARVLAVRAPRRIRTNLAASNSTRANINNPHLWWCRHNQAPGTNISHHHKTWGNHSSFVRISVDAPAQPNPHTKSKRTTKLDRLASTGWTFSQA